MNELTEWGMNPKFITYEFLLSQGLGSSIPIRFIKKVIRSNGCWNWQKRSRLPKGYGKIGRGNRAYRTNPISAHRLSWILHFGPIPDGIWVLHSCDNPSCVRPDHLWLGTSDDNIADMHKKGRAAGGSLKGSQNPKSKLSESDVAKIRNFSKKETQKEIAKMFGVTVATISGILNRKFWHHV